MAVSTGSPGSGASGVEVRARSVPRQEDVLTGDALALLGRLHREFAPAREDLLRARRQRQERIDAGEMPDFLAATADVRHGDWRVAEVPPDLQHRRVEITGPTDRKMVINALNSGANVFMADFEDANTPSWINLVSGQANLTDAIERTIAFDAPDGRSYRLNEEVATLVVRPRGWHLPEKHVVVDGTVMSGSLFDFGLYLFHNATRLLDRGSGPYFYLPKLEGHLEARLWNEVFSFSEDALGLTRGTVKATVLVETILAAFEIDEILFELRDHAAGANAGRWDYIFSIIKKFHRRDDFVLPDRHQVTMTVPFMRTYTDLLVTTCHRRGAHAIGGMSAFVPSRRDPSVNERAFANVQADKTREASDGFDGTWVAHPDLVAVARDPFDEVLGSRPHQKERRREDVSVTAAELLDVAVPGGTITEEGLRNDVGVAIRYLSSWLRGAGAVAVFNLMEDAATCEIARSQVWQWVRHGAKFDDGTVVDRALVESVEREELEKLRRELGDEAYAKARIDDAAALFGAMWKRSDFVEFLTLPAYALVD